MIEQILFTDIPYQEYIAWQDKRVKARINDEVNDAIAIMTFSNPVYTTPAKHDGLTIELVESKRGGEDSYHGPGQICICPLIKVPDPIDFREFTTRLEYPIRQLCKQYGLEVEPRAKLPGLTIDGKKIAQVGLHVEKNVFSYGLAFNVTCDLDYFDAIDLCGIPNCPVTNLATETGLGLNCDQIAMELIEPYLQVFDYEQTPRHMLELD